MLGKSGRHLRAGAAPFVIAGLLATAAFAAELTPNTVEAFHHYIHIREAQMEEELQNGQKFLWFEQYPEPRRQSLYEQLRQGQVSVERLETLENNKPIKVPKGLVHHWVGGVFIPGATLEQTMAVVQDYDHHEIIYKPDVRHSKLLHRDGNNFQVSMQLYKKTIVTVAMNAQFDVRYFALDASRAYSRSYSTRIAEVEGLGKSDEHEMSEGQGHGYLWRMDSYWRFWEKDGGVYVQIESIGLSRGVPAIFVWLVRPLLSSIPRETLSNLLNCTRVAVVNQNKAVGIAGRIAFWLTRPQATGFGSPEPLVSRRRYFPTHRANAWGKRARSFPVSQDRASEWDRSREFRTKIRRL